jgi:hypothetical protein
MICYLVWTKSANIGGAVLSYVIGYFRWFTCFSCVLRLDTCWIQNVWHLDTCPRIIHNFKNWVTESGSILFLLTNHTILVSRCPTNTFSQKHQKHSYFSITTILITWGFDAFQKWFSLLKGLTLFKDLMLLWKLVIVRQKMPGRSDFDGFVISKASRAL